MWTKIRKVTLSSSWTQTITNYYSDGVGTGISTGSFSGEATHRYDSSATYVNDVGYFGTGPTLSFAGPMMGVTGSSGFSGACKGSGSQSSTSTYPDGSTDNYDPIFYEFGTFMFARESLFNTSDIREAVNWSITAFAGTGPYDNSSRLVIPWGDFDQGGTWSNSWEETLTSDTGSSTIVTAGTWTLTLSL